MYPATLLVPGWSDTARALRHCERFLLAAGWLETHVAAVDFRNRYGSNLEHADEIGAAVERLRRSSAASSVAIVAHSMGGLAAREYLTRADRPPVHSVIFVATPHRGTWAAWLAWGRGGAEMRPGSGFLRALNARPLPARLQAFCLSTPIDTRVLPGASALLDGAECHRVALPTHPRMLRHPPTLNLIRDLLLRSANPPRGTAQRFA